MLQPGRSSALQQFGNDSKKTLFVMREDGRRPHNNTRREMNTEMPEIQNDGVTEGRWFTNGK